MYSTVPAVHQNVRSAFHTVVLRETALVRQGLTTPADVGRSESGAEVIVPSGWPTDRSELTASFASDHVHACHTMYTVHAVSIVAKNKYSGNAGG